MYSEEAETLPNSIGMLQQSGRSFHSLVLGRVELFQHANVRAECCLRYTFAADKCVCFISVLRHSV